jgi:hypothetical protein
VNNVGGVVVYYSWNAESESWVKEDFSGGGGSGIPEISGTSERPIVLSELEPGLYRVKGVYKIAPNTDTTVFTTIDHIAFVSDDDAPKIKVITDNSIYDYIVTDDTVTFISEYATKQYISDNYTTITYVDNKIAALESEISQIIDDFHEKVVTIVYEVLGIALDSISSDYIQNLFNE